MATRFSSDAANKYFAAVGRYGLNARKVTAAVDITVDAMNDVLLAFLIERTVTHSDVDLRAIVAQRIVRASAAIAQGMKLFGELGDPAEIFLSKRQAQAATAVKSGTQKMMAAASNLLLICENPFKDDVRVWLDNFVEYSGRFLDTRAATLAASLVGANKRFPSTHFGLCLLSVSRMDRQVFNLLLACPVQGTAPDQSRDRLQEEAARAHAAIRRGKAALPRFRRRISSLASLRAEMIKPLQALDELERSFDVECRLVDVLASLAEEGISPQTVLDRYQVVRDLGRERVRLIERRYQIMAA